MRRIRVGYAPVGIKVSPGGLEDYPTADKYSGHSYCDAVRIASDGSGRALLLTPDSINVCRWSPVVLGFREPDPGFDLKVEFNLTLPTDSLLVAPVSDYKDGHPPDVVLVRTTPREMRKIIDALGRDNLASNLGGGLDRSALSALQRPGGASGSGVNRILLVNELLARLSRVSLWNDFTKWAMNKKWTTYALDQLLDRFLANMSMCRNSTVIPYLTEKTNVSCFCTGGVSWGRNSPSDMTCGMPYAHYKKLDWKWE